MITITKHEDQKKRCLSLCVKGHAGAAPVGQDIICAAVSILTFTLAERVHRMAAAGELARPPTVTLAAGDADIEIQCCDARTFRRARRDFLFATAGYALLAAQYPLYVAVK